MEKYKASQELMERAATASTLPAPEWPAVNPPAERLCGGTVVAAMEVGTIQTGPTIIQTDEISSIRKDSEGRYCLNDLHKAAGGEDRHGPDRFFRTDAGGGLLLELANSPEMANKVPLSSSRGRYGGTYVVKELVYAYAMWVSPAFHLKVIRFFDRGATQGVAVADHAAADLLAMALGRALETSKCVSCASSRPSTPAR